MHCNQTKTYDYFRESGSPTVIYGRTNIYNFIFLQKYIYYAQFDSLNISVRVYVICSY